VGYESAIVTAGLLAECGAPVVIVADAMNKRCKAVAGSVVEERDGLCKAAWSSSAKLLQKISTKVNGLGVQAVFHHHAGTYSETPSEIDQILSITDPSLLGLYLETGHYFYGGGHPVKLAHNIASRIWHLHLKDIRGDVVERVR